MLSWLNKIKPFLDAYHAPYNRKHRYWTGLLLLVHCALSLTFALNALGSDSVNLIAITSVTACLIAWLRWKIYVKLFFHSQLVHTFSSYLLCQGYQWQSGWPCLAYTFVGIALTTLVCIVVFHIYIQLKATAIWKSILGKLGLFVRSDDAVANNIISVSYTHLRAHETLR